MVVSVTAKGVARSRHVSCRETNESEPLMKGRKRIDDVKTGRESLARDKSGGGPVYCPDGVRLRGGVKLRQVLARNMGTLPTMRRETAKWKTHKAPRTDAWVRGGLTRSSEESQ